MLKCFQELYTADWLEIFKPSVADLFKQDKGMSSEDILQYLLVYS